MSKKKKKKKKLRKWEKLPERKKEELKEAKKIGRGVEEKEVKEGARNMLKEETFKKMNSSEAAQEAIKKADKRIEELHEKGMINKKMKDALKAGSGEEELVKFKKFLEKL